MLRMAFLVVFFVAMRFSSVEIAPGRLETNTTIATEPRDERLAA